MENWNIPNSFLLLCIHQPILMYGYHQKGIPIQTFGNLHQIKGSNSLLLGQRLLSKKNSNELHLLFPKPYVWQNECIFAMSSSLQSQFGHWVKVSCARMSLYVLISMIQSIYSFKLANWLQLQHEFRGTCTWRKFEILTSDSGMLVLEW